VTVAVDDFEIEVKAARTAGGWQAEGLLPNGHTVISGPKTTQDEAVDDVVSQAKAYLRPQRRYDVNRPMESKFMRQISEADMAVVLHQADQLLEAPPMIENKWIQKAINPEHKGYCSPMSKSTCTPRRKALARRFKRGDLHDKASFYPSDGGMGGGGGGTTTD
jgi:hypothetical protein